MLLRRLISNIPVCVSCYVAPDIDRSGQSRDMRGGLLNGYGKSGRGASEALRSDTETVYLFKYALFHIGVKRLRIFHRDVAAERFFCKICAVLKVSAQTYSYYHWGTGVAACGRDGFHTKIFYTIEQRRQPSV